MQGWERAHRHRQKETSEAQSTLQDNTYSIMSSPDRKNSRGMDRKPAARRGKREKSRMTAQGQQEKSTTLTVSSASVAARKPAPSSSPVSKAPALSSATKKEAASSSTALAVAPAAATEACHRAPQVALCRFFVLNGYCKFGDACFNSHTVPEGGIVEARKQVPCPFYLKGSCRFGSGCALRHDSQDLVHVEEQASAASFQQEAYTCGICLEPLGQEYNRRFGLLEGCEHVYCLDCLRTWRKDGSREAQDRRFCPTCRTKSFYVIPSWTYSAGEEKEQVVDGYKAKLANLPCKRFNGTLGSCPFGSDCFYMHIRNGVNVKDQDQTMEEIHEEREARRRRAHSVDDLEIIHAFLMLLEFTRDMEEWEDDSLNFTDDEDDFDDVFERGEM